MKRLVIFAALTFASPAFAQQAAPSQDELISAFYLETGALRTELGKTQKQVIELKKQLEAAKAAVPKTDEAK